MTIYIIFTIKKIKIKKVRNNPSKLDNRFFIAFGRICKTIEKAVPIIVPYLLQTRLDQV